MCHCSIVVTIPFSRPLGSPWVANHWPSAGPGLPLALGAPVLGLCFVNFLSLNLGEVFLVSIPHGNGSIPDCSVMHSFL